jgi:phage gp29-like protein
MPKHALRYRHHAMKFADGTQQAWYAPDEKLSDQMTDRKQMTSEIAVRETAWDYYRVLGYLPNPDKILRKLGKDIDEYEQLLADSRVKGAFNSRRAGTLSLEWEIDQMEAAPRPFKTIKEVFKDYPMQDLIADMMQAVFFGYQPTEVIWKKTGAYVLPIQVVTKPARWFRYSDTNELRYLTKRNMITGEPVAKYKFLVPRYHPSYGNPYGEALGSAVYWPVKFRHTGFRYFTTFIERYAMPWLKFSYPLGMQDFRVSEMVNILSSTLADGVIAVPAETPTEILDIGKETSANIYKEFIDLCNTEIAIAILGQNLTTEVQGGSYAAAKAHQLVRRDLIDEDVRMITDTMNTLIDWIYEINFGDQPRPSFRLSQKPQMYKDDAQMAVYMTQAGVKFTEQYWLNRGGLTEDEFELGPTANDTQLQLGQMKVESDKQKAESAGNAGGAEDSATNDAMHDARDPARNTPSYKATKAVRSGKGY